MGSTKPPDRNLSPRIPRNEVLLSYLGVASLWIFANVFSEQLEDITFFLETAFAVTQWLVLRLCFRRMGYWALVSVLGWILAFILIRWFDFGGAIAPFIPGESLEIIVLSITVQTFWTSVIVRAVEWLIIGFCQWLLLRCRIKRAMWWIWASAIAGGVKGALELSIRSLGGGVWSPWIGAFGYGVVTAIALIWLLHYNFELERRQLK